MRRTHHGTPRESKSSNEGRSPADADDRPSPGVGREGDVWGDVRDRLDITASAHRFSAADSRRIGQARPRSLLCDGGKIEPEGPAGHLPPTTATGGSAVPDSHCVSTKAGFSAGAGTPDASARGH